MVSAMEGHDNQASAMSRVFIEGARAVDAPANRSFLLDAAGVWFVEQGRIDVFCLRVAADGTIADRTYVARVLAGRCLFGALGGDGGGARGSDFGMEPREGDAADGAPCGDDFPPQPPADGDAAALEAAAREEPALGEPADSEPPRGVLQAVGSEGTTLRFLAESAARARFADEALRAEGAQLIDAWVEAIYAELAAGALPPDCEALESGAKVRLQPAATASPRSGVVWIDHVEGQSGLLGRPDLPLGGLPIPCSTRAWFAASTASTVRVAATTSLIERGAVWESLGAFGRLATRACLLAVDERSAGERRRQQRRSAERDALLRDAFTELVTAHDAAADEQPLPGRPAPGEGAGQEGLGFACRQVGAALGLALTPGSKRTAAALADPVAAVARASAVRVRQVLLEDGWWRSDSGPLLGRTAGDGGRWVALLPASPRSYAISDPSDGTEKPVTAAVASTLAPIAHAFYRTFPTGRLSLRDVLRFGVRGCRRDLFLIVALGLGGGLLGLVTPVATGALFNSIVPGAERGQLLQVTLILLASAFATGMFELVRRLALVRVDGRMGAAVQAAIWDRLLSLPLRFFRPYSAGDLAVRAMGIDTLRKTLSGATVTAALGGLFSLSNFALLFHYGDVLAWWATLLLLAAGGVSGLVGYGQLRLQRRIVPLRARTSGLVLQLLTGISKLRVAAAEGHAFAQWARLFSQQRRLQFLSRSVGNWLRVFNAMFPTLSLLVIMAAATAGGDAVPQIRTGDYLAFSTAFGACLAAMISMSTAVVEALGAVPVYESAKPILDAEPEVHHARGDPGALTGGIEARHLTFHYLPDLPPALSDVSFTARPGEFIAFVGASGSGKSTLLRVLLGFEQPDSGSVYFDGQDFSRLDVQAVRSQIGVVLQSGRVMAGDFFTNIVGSTGKTLEDAWEAARMAGLAEDIKAMPMGMHTVVSEGANTLSGGQRQRLLIARAIVNKPRIVFFDEATSALDNRTQAIVSESLERLHATRIVIAHRLSTIVNAHRLHVMERGRVVQSGSYAELVARDGPFAALARRQMH